MTYSNRPRWPVWPRPWPPQATAPRHVAHCGGGARRRPDGGTPPAAADDPAARLRRVEAVLFLAREPVPSRKLAQLAGLADATEARTLVRQLNQRYDRQSRAFRAEEVAGGYQLLTRPALAPWLRRLSHVPDRVQLTPPALEALAIVAYRQPVLRADVEAIRGVNCGEILRQLMDRDLVRISGRSEELGRPYLYSTSKRFLQIFGLRNIEALPHADWFHRESDFLDPSDRSAPASDTAPGTADKEPPVSVQPANPLLDADAAANPPVAETGAAATDAPHRAAPTAAIEDDEDELYEGDSEEYDDEEDDELEDDELEDEELDEEEEFEDDELDDEEELDDDELDEEDEGWEEVGEEDEDEDWDDDEEWDDEGDEEDEDEDWD